jgi:hypothetical protein
MPDITVTRQDEITDWDEYYTCEFKGSKGWEIVWFTPKTEGLHKVLDRFRSSAVNSDGQFRLTIPA